eukprot:6195265-Pleurochrysis_carterae.AAC.1
MTATSLSMPRQERRLSIPFPARADGGEALHPSFPAIAPLPLRLRRLPIAASPFTLSCVWCCVAGVHGGGAAAVLLGEGVSAAAAHAPAR